MCRKRNSSNNNNNTNMTDTDDNRQRPSTCYRTFLHVCDVLCTCFIFFPLMVMYWRGIWDLWGVFIYPDDVVKRTFITLPIGAFAVVFYIAAPAVEKSLTSYKKSSRRCYYFLVRVYLYTFATFYMCYWRAVWETADLYMSAATWQCGLTWLICWTVLCALGVMRTAIFPPYLINLDTRDEVLTVCTRFSTKPYTCAFFADVFFSYFFVLTVVIVTWRCIWNFLYALVLPGDPITADFLFLGLGFLFALGFFALEPPLAEITLAMEKRGFYYKVAWEDFVYTCVHLASVMLWIGGWNGCATYMIPDMFLGGVVNHVAGTVGLMLVQLFSYAGALGIGRDGLDPGASAIFPIRYFRHYLLDDDGFVQEPEEEDIHDVERHHRAHPHPPPPSITALVDKPKPTSKSKPRPESQQPMLSEPTSPRVSYPLSSTGFQQGQQASSPLYTPESELLMKDDRCITFDV